MVASPVRRRHPELLTDPDQVIRALTRFNDARSPRSGSLLSVGNGAKRQSFEVFSYGFLSHIEEDEELVHRLRGLSARDRLLLLLWYAEGWPVTAIADHLHLSRVHCYRVRNQALARLSAPSGSLPHTTSNAPAEDSPRAVPSRCGEDEDVQAVVLPTDVGVH